MNPISQVVQQQYEANRLEGRTLLPEKFMDHFYFESILSSMQIGITIFDAVKGKCIHVTEEITDMLEMTAQEYLDGWPAAGDAVMAQEYLADFGVAMQEAGGPWMLQCLDAVGKPMVLHLFVPIRPKSGRLKWMHQRTIPISWTENGQLLAAIFVATNITDLPFEKKVVAYFTQMSNDLEITFLLKDKNNTELQLSNKAYEVLRHICQGKTREEIADACNMSAHTVDKYRKDIMRQLGVSKKAQLIQVAHQYNLV